MEGDEDGYSAVHLVEAWTDLLLAPLYLHQRGSAVVRSVDAPDILVVEQWTAPMTESRRTQRTAWRTVRSSTVARPVEECTAQQMLDLPWSLRNGTWWPTVDVDVCKPDCE